MHNVVKRFHRCFGQYSRRFIKMVQDSMNMVLIAGSRNRGLEYQILSSVAMGSFVANYKSSTLVLYQ
jgi:hypothetical protein